MTDGQLLYFVFVAFYLFDGLIRLPRHAWVFVRPGWSRRKWRIIRPREIASRLGEGYGLLPLLGTCLPTGDGFWFHREKGIHWVDSPESDGRLAVIQSPEKLWREKCRITGPNKVGVLTFPSVTAATKIIRWLKSDSFEVSQQRQESLSLPRARALLKRCRIIDRCFGFWTGILAVYIFLFLPLAFSYYHTTQPRLFMVLVVFYITLAISLQWWFVVKRISPNRGKGRWYKILPLIFLPYHTLRMPQQLAMELAAGVHPLALGKACLDPDTFLKFAAEFMRGIRYPINQLVSEEDWQEQYGVCSAFLSEKCCVPPEAWEDEVPERDKDGASYCPRCLSQYVEQKTVCNTCRDLKTREFPPSAAL